MNIPHWSRRPGASLRALGTLLRLGAVTLLLVTISACQQKMARQPYFKPLEETEFFADGRASRPLVAGTVPLGQPSSNNALLTGLTPEGRKAKARSDGSAAIPEGAPDDVKNYVDVFPFEMTKDELLRGMERFTIFCTPCHGPLGDGHGKIVERGYLKPTSFHGEMSRGFGRYRINLPLKDAPVGYYFEVISKGFGGMPDYSSQIDAADRWRIIAYIRVLQLSQGAHLRELPADVQEAAKKADQAPEKAAKETPGGHH